MTKAKAETPTEAIDQGRKTVRKTDKRGRLITVRRLNALQYYNVIKAMGGSSDNSALVDMALLAAAVTAINTTKFTPPSTEKDIQFLIQELDFDGFAAISEAMAELLAAEAEDAKGMEAAVKNSAGGPISD